MARRELMRGGGEITRREWDPLARFRELLSWDPFAAIWEAFPTERMPAGFSPDFDICESHDKYVFKADLPGIREQDLEVTVTGNRLTVAGKREMDETKADERYYARERLYGSFTRSFTLPEGIDVDNIRTELREGVLSIEVPKKPEVQPRKIEVKVGRRPEQAKA